VPDYGGDHRVTAHRVRDHRVPDHGVRDHRVPGYRSS
jgi:hypothetical protein